MTPQEELKKTTFLQDRFDYICEHVVTETMDRDDYWNKLLEQFKDVKVTVEEHELKLVSMEAFATRKVSKGNLVSLFFKIIK